MSALTPLQINQSYLGLLKLSDSTTGITSTLQAVEDGLGNDTGLNIATNRLEGGNLLNYNRPSTPQYFGNGFTATAVNPGAVQNQLVCNIIYDNGLHSYSAITVNCLTLEAGTSVDIAFYNTQYLDTYGIAPYQKLVTEVSADTTTTGIKTITFGTPLSFSATGAGIYWVVFRYNTPGTPILRLTGVANTNFALSNNWLNYSNLGLVYNTAGTAIMQSFRVNSTTSNLAGMVLNTATFPNPMTSTQLNTITSTSVSSAGFILHTIR
jgi:hypothetical protein